MKKVLPGLMILLIPLIFISAGDILPSGVYEWQKLIVRKTRTGEVRNILKSSTRSLEMFEIKAVTLPGGYGFNKYRIKKGIDELIIIKEGMAVISVNDKSERLNEGSVVVASQGDEIRIQNGAKNDLTYYSFQFSPRQTEAMPQTIKKVESVIKEWRDIEFKPNANGGRRDIMRQPTSMLKELEMHTTTLKEGLPSHNSHTHPDEEIILVRFGKVEESINGKPYQCGPGSVIFLTNDDDHGIRNIGEGQCEYYAIRWLTYTSD
jgi:quercetin dioxygenase-like cupin family protein